MSTFKQQPSLLICLLASLLLAGCGTTVRQGSARPAPSLTHMRVLLPPIHNATPDESAGPAMTEMTGTALYQQGVRVVQTEAGRLSSAKSEAAGPDGRFAEVAQAHNATHLLLGTVTEYRYKTDLDGDPAVGLTLRLVEASSGETIWQGSASKTGFFYTSVSEASQKAVDELVRKLVKAAKAKKKH